MTTESTTPMPAWAFGSPAVRRRRLAAELRQLRLNAGLTIDEVAGKLEWSSAKISRIENALVSVLPRDVKFLLGIYGMVDNADRERLLTLSQESRQKAWWHRYDLTAVPAWLRTYADMEAEAAILFSYHPELVPDLFQSSGYRSALLQAALPGPADQDSDQVTTLLLARQERLAVIGTPRLHAIVGEAVLRREVGGPATMADQLDRLAHAMREPGITVQVLPFASGAHPAMDSPFGVMTFPDPADPDIACTGRHGALCLDTDADVQHCQQTFAQLRNMALPPDTSLTLITRAAAELCPAGIVQ